MAKPTARAINKPRLIVGIDRTWFGLSLILAAVVLMGAHGVVGKVGAIVFFFALCAFGSWLYKDDPKLLTVLGIWIRRRAIYDPSKQSNFELIRERNK